MKEKAMAALIAARDAARNAQDPSVQVQSRLAYMQDDMLRSHHFKVLHDDPRWAELTADPE
jgi:hypothetical protein